MTEDHPLIVFGILVFGLAGGFGLPFAVTWVASLLGVVL